MNRRKVIIVDDSPEFGEMLRRRLAQDAPHFETCVADSGEDCLSILKEGAYDCILSDYQMPGMDGLELLMAVRARGDDTPFIMVTGQGNEGLVREAFKAGAYDYFTKDAGFAHYDRLVNSVEQAINHRLAGRLARKAELALIEEKNKLDEVLSCIGDAISIQDTDYRVLYQNTAHRELAGSHEGEHCYRAYSHNDNVCGDCPVALSFADGKAHTVQKPGRVDKGEVFVEINASPLRDASGRIVGGIESVRDITARKKADDALEDSERFLASVFESIQDGMIVLDDEYNIVRVNATVEGWYAHAMPLVGKKCYDALQNRTAPCGSCPSMRSLDTGLAISGEAARRGRDGEHMGWLEVHRYPLYDAVTGKRKGVIEYLRDITERKRLERERSDFYAMVSHDIKSPLSTIIGYSEILSMPDTRIGDGEAREMVDGIQKSAGRVAGLVEDFLTVSRMDSGRVEPHRSLNSVAELLDEVSSEYEQVFARNRIRYTFEAAGRLPASYIDRRLVARAVSNLLGNAAKYTQAGGEVRLTAGPVAEGGRPWFYVSVEDDGPGIPPEEQGRVFEMYYRASGSDGTKGTGLGLAIVKAAAEAHGGRVELESSPGKGSTFRLVIPVMPE